VIFLTGGSGLIGLHAIDELRDHGYEVQALARSAAAAATLGARGANPVMGSIEDPATWERVEGCRAIVHCAAIIISNAEWPRWESVNVGATRLAAARARALGVPLVHISSIAVYGREDDGAPDGSIAEDHPLQPLPAGRYYHRTKRMAEAVVQEEVRRGLDATVLRPCLVYGEGDRLFLPRLARLARTGRFPLVGRGDRPMTMVHARSVAQAIRLSLQRPGRPGRAYNVTNDDAMTGLELIAALGEGIGRPVRPIRIPSGLATGVAAAADGVLRLVRPALPGGARSAVNFLRGGNPYTSARARNELGWDPPIRHRTAVPAAVRSLGRS
jgi:nucleoside-diphosphate-sugar epimerase